MPLSLVCLGHLRLGLPKVYLLHWQVQLLHNTLIIPHLQYKLQCYQCCVLMLKAYTILMMSTVSS